MPEPSFLQRLKERKLVQWALAYLAGAWVLAEVSDVVGGRWNLPDTLYQGFFILLGAGFFITLVLAWYHGENGRQQVSGPELLMIAILLVICGAVLSILGPEQSLVRPLAPTESGSEEDNAAALRRLPGIAVLPFANRSDLSSDQYFADGIQDELLTRLQRVPGLRVISRTSSEIYRATDKTIPEIGRELGVGYVLEGGVQRAGDRVRITAQLIDAVNEGHLWAETYDQVLTPQNLFDIQSEIVSTVAGALNIELRQEERLRAARRSTMDPEAFDLYLRGITREADDAVPLFQAAIDRDPRFVGAYAALAARLSRQYQMGVQRSEEIAERARTAAEQALALAPESEDARLAMGIYLYRVEKDYEGALEWLSGASGTLLGDYDYHYYRANAERRMGRWGPSVASRRAALSLSPRVSTGWNELALTYLCMRRYGDADAALLEARGLGDESLLYRALLTWFRDESTQDWEPYTMQFPTIREAWEIPMIDDRPEDALAVLNGMPPASVGQHHWYPKALMMAETLEALGREEEARAQYRAAVAVLEPLISDTPEDERYRASLGWAYAGLGMRDEAVREARTAAELMSREKDALGGPFFLFDLAAVHARLGEVEEALNVLADLLSAPARFAPILLEDHFRLRTIRNDPGFRTLMDRERDRVF